MERRHEPLPTHVEQTPPLPPAYHHALDAGLASIGIDLAADIRAKIDGHVRLLLAWTAVVNLTAIRDPVAVATSHVLDSLTAVASLRAAGVDRLLDLGSGGGFPGLPLALALPVAEARLVEPIGKKARFLATTIAAIGATDRLSVATTRAESLAADPVERGRWAAVTARAVAPTPELVELAFPLLAEGGRLIAWKRGDLAAELAAARRAADALGGGTIDVVAVGVPGLEGHRLVVVTRTGRVPPRYPRDPAARRRQPW